MRVDPRSTSRTRRSSSAGTSPTCPTWPRGSTPTTSSRAKACAWFRRFLGEDADRPIRHPEIVSGIGTRNMGVAVRDRRGDVAATLIPSVGCPMGCNFCSTSAMFGGKGKSVDFYQTGDELFDVMRQLERDMERLARSSSWTRTSSSTASAPCGSWN